nr:CaiB/BaiF CoA-transferase family protein [Candidatus Sigynarchaeota archaeon]
TKDMARFTPPFVMGDKSRIGSLFYQINRNKKSITLDYTKPEGHDLLLKLVKQAHVLVESFKPGTMDHFGLDKQALFDANPSLVLCSVSGYGQSGPRAREPGHDMNYLSLAGLIGLNGPPSCTDPLPFPIPFADYIGALYAVIGVIAEIAARSLHAGAGNAVNGFTHVDASIFESAISLLHLYNTCRMMGKPEFCKGEEVLSGYYPFYRVYACKDGKHLVLGAIEQKFWDGFCEAIGREDLKTEQFSGIDYITGEMGLKPKVSLEQITKDIEAIMLTRDRDEWVSLLNEHGVCCTPVNDMHDVWEDPHVKARGISTGVVDPRYGLRPHLRLPLLFNGEPLSITPAPEPGQHNEEILGPLGIEPDAWARLKRKRVI